MMTVLLVVVLALTAPQEREQERPNVPKDSIEVVVTGCLKGRMLAVSDVRETDVQRGPVIKARSFRLAGKKDVMDVVKQEDRHVVDVTGLIKRSALNEPGMKVGKGVTIGGGAPVAGSGGSGMGRPPAPTENIPVMDVTSIRGRGTSCGS